MSNTKKRNVASAIRSPLNHRRWLVQLDCGCPEFWVTNGVKPKSWACPNGCVYIN